MCDQEAFKRKKGKKMGQTLVLPWWRHSKFWKILDPFDEKWKIFGPPNDVTEKPHRHLVHLMTSQEVLTDRWRHRKLWISDRQLIYSQTTLIDIFDDVTGIFATYLIYLWRHRKDWKTFDGDCWRVERPIHRRQRKAAHHDQQIGSRHDLIKLFCCHNYVFLLA